MSEASAFDGAVQHAAPAGSDPSPQYVHGDPGLLAVQMLAPGRRPPDIEPAELDADAIRVIRGLRAEGHQAYLVGGCVRDLLAGFSPKDFDIATSAQPGEIRSAFRNCRLIGRRFRLAHVHFRNDKIIEVATFRRNPKPDAEGSGEPSAALSVALSEAALATAAESAVEEAIGEEGAPEAVEGAEKEPVEVEEELSADLLITEDNTFGTVEEDATRRDFTINGLFYDVTLGRVLDFVGGVGDLARGRVRTIGDPEVRLREDPVRLLRAVRFASKLGFEIEALTYAACEAAVEDLPRCAPPRLLDETFKLLKTGAATQSFHLLDALGALPMLLPAFAKALKSGGKERWAEVQAMLKALDAALAAGEAFDDGFLFAVLLEPVVRASGLDAVDPLLEELIRTSRLPRRIADQVRTLLQLQSVLSGQRKRRRSVGSFRSAPAFAPALRLFAMRVAATGQLGDLLERWQSGGAAPEPTRAEPAESAAQGDASPNPAGHDTPVSVPAAPAEAAAEGEESEGGEEGAAEGESTEPGRKRRRRRRRRGGGGGAAAEGSAAAPPAGEPPTS